MKKILAIILLFISILVFAQENKFVKSAQTKNATILQTGNTQNWCSVCGMNLKMFYKTNHALKLNKGTAIQYCSMRCLCVDKPNYKNHILKILVVDANSEKFINVENAFYVIGSKAQGTMTKISKIAFLKKEDAEEFSKKSAMLIQRYPCVAGKIKIFRGDCKKQKALNIHKEAILEGITFI